MRPELDATHHVFRARVPRGEKLVRQMILHLTLDRVEFADQVEDLLARSWCARLGFDEFATHVRPAMRDSESTALLLQSVIGGISVADERTAEVADQCPSRFCGSTLVEAIDDCVRCAQRPC